MNEQKDFPALRDWFFSLQGQDVGHAFTRELHAAQIVDGGQCLLQLGDCGENIWLDALSYRAKWIADSIVLPHKNSIQSLLTTMPFDRDSMDCIIAPLAIEIYGRDLNFLDEIDRILKPMGYLIILGINPWSFWGISLRWGRLSKFGRALSTFSSSLSIKHAMVARGYRQCWLSNFYYLPPVKSEYYLRKLEFLNQMSKMIWPYPAGFYCLILQKYDPCMTVLPRTARNEWRLIEI